MVATETIIQIAIGIAISVLSATLLNFIKEWKADKKEREANREKLEERVECIAQAQIELLGKQIEDGFYYYTECGFIPADKLAQIRQLYEVYHRLGGNGVRTMEVEKLEELPNSPDLIGERRHEKDN